MKLKEERIESLTESKNLFFSFVQKYYEIEKFSGPSEYFHTKVIRLIKDSEYGLLLKDEHFIEYVYATLASWGMHRMGPGGSKMKGFKEFRDSVLTNYDSFLELKRYRLDKLTDEDKEKVMKLLADLFKNLKVMESDSNLVGNSKVIHHLLPDLVPPIDRQHTVKFFYGNLNAKYNPRFSKDEELDMFLEIFDCFRIICKKLNLSENDYDKSKPWNTSIPKLIDNAIIGYV